MANKAATAGAKNIVRPRTRKAATAADATSATVIPGNAAYPHPMGAAADCDRTNHVSPPQTSKTIAGNTTCRVQALTPRGSAIVDGRDKQATASINGYSTAVEKTKGASRALKSPPRTPPNDIHK